MQNEWDDKIANINDHPLYTYGAPEDDVAPEELAIEFETEFGPEAALKEAKSELAKVIEADDTILISFWRAVNTILVTRRRNRDGFTRPF